MADSVPVSLTIDPFVDDKNARSFCEDYLSGHYPKFVFGRNEWAVSIAKVVDVDGFIDDFTDDKEYLWKPVFKTEDVPKNALVVVVVVGRPFVAEKCLIKHGIRFLDYFAFKHYSNINLAPIKFWDKFKVDFQTHQVRYERIYNMLHDDESKRVLHQIINFRLSSDLSYMRGFTDTQYRQYFEDFLELKPEGEVFIDVGGFDGYTSLEFIKRCPGYAAVHLFEPEQKNMTVATENLASWPQIHYYLRGLSNHSATLRFSANGSISQINDEGDIEIQVVRFDDVLNKPFTFLKMDIEGGEIPALEGMKQAIINHHPRLAISVYHRFDDLWRIPELVLSFREDYEIYLRHYTEGIDETVMFFIPAKGSNEN